LWFNPNVCAFKWSTADDDVKNPDASHIHELRDQFKQQLLIRVGTELFVLLYVDKVRLSDQPILDMMLESLSRRQVSSLEIRELRAREYLHQLQPFSSGALRQFLEGNTMLKVVSFNKLLIDSDASDFLGRFSRGLDSIQFRECYLDFQQFANGVGANMFGPETIVIKFCYNKSILASNAVPHGRLSPREPGYDFAWFMVSLLGNPSLKVLHLYTNGYVASIGTLEILKSAFKSNQNLEDLHICDEFKMQDSNR
jgi:hypothetical protein